jgi:hypothetical protein
LAAFVEAVRMAGEQRAISFAVRWASSSSTLSVRRDVLPDSNLALFTWLSVGVVCSTSRCTRPCASVDDLRRSRMGAVVAAAAPSSPDRNRRGRLATDTDSAHTRQWLCLTASAQSLLLAYRPVWSTRLALFGHAGRMALTNYMLQIIILDALGSGYVPT